MRAELAMRAKLAMRAEPMTFLYKKVKSTYFGPLQWLKSKPNKSIKWNRGSQNLCDLAGLLVKQRGEWGQSFWCDTLRKRKKEPCRWFVANSLTNELNCVLKSLRQREQLAKVEVL